MMAHVMAGARHGGAELFFERLVTALHDAGEVVVPVIRRDRERKARLLAAGVNPVQMSFGGLFDRWSTWQLGRVLRVLQPRVTVAWMNRAARHTPQGDWVLAGRLGGFYDLRYYRHCDRLIGNTRGICDWIAGQGVAAARIHHLPNFAPDLAGAPPARLPVPPGVPVILALGRLHPNKAFDVLIRALARVPRAHAVIAGEGPESGTLDGLAREVGVADRVHLIGWSTDTAGLLAACDVLVCPSRHEPLGNVIIEAFSAARPVIAAAAQGPRELIRDGIDGVLVPLDKPAALAGAIASVLADRSAAARLAAAGRAAYLERHAEAPVLDQWRDFLAHVRKP